MPPPTRPLPFGSFPLRLVLRGAPLERVWEAVSSVTSPSTSYDLSLSSRLRTRTRDRRASDATVARQPTPVTLWCGCAPPPQERSRYDGTHDFIHTTTNDHAQATQPMSSHDRRQASAHAKETGSLARSTLRFTLSVSTHDDARPSTSHSAPTLIQQRSERPRLSACTAQRYDAPSLGPVPCTTPTCPSTKRSRFRQPPWIGHGLLRASRRVSPSRARATSQTPGPPFASPS